MSLADLFQVHRSAIEGGVTIRVTSGAHSGALAALRRGAATVGSSLDNDIVLIGDGLEQNHFALGMANPWLGTVEVEPMDAGVRVNGKIVDVGRKVVARAPLTIDAGRASLELTPKLRFEPFRRPAIAAAAIVAVMAVGLPLFEALSSASTFTPPAYDAASSFAPTKIDPASHAAVLEERIRKADLAGAVTADPGPAGAIVATGEVDEAGLARWRTVLQWHDAIPGAPLLINNVAKTSEIPGVNIRSAWLDGTPELILTNGQTVGVGGALSGGWRVTQIDAGGIVIAKDKLSRRIEF